MTKAHKEQASETCDACSKTICLTKYGVFRHHTNGDFRNGGGTCAGAGHAPHRVTEAVSTINSEHEDNLPYYTKQARIGCLLNPPTPEERT